MRDSLSVDNRLPQSEQLVSIIIVTYNSSDYIVNCLRALQAQAYQTFEIIVYDNASHDETTTLIRTHFSTVHLISGETNIGFAAANNRAARQAAGDYLAFLNPDTVVEAHWLSPLIDILASDTAVGAVTPQIIFADNPSRVNTCGNDIHLSGITFCQRYNQPVTSDPPYTVSAVSGAAFVISRPVFKALGGFADKFFMYYEDTDLSLRIRCLGLNCTAVPQALVQHVYQPTFSPQKIFYLERNRYLSLFSLVSWQLFLLMLPSLLLMEFVAWGYALMQGKAAIAAKGRAWLSVVQARGWIAERRSEGGCRSANLLPIFQSRLRVQYVAAGSPTLLHGVELAAWLLAAPALHLGKWLIK